MVIHDARRRRQTRPLRNPLKLGEGGMGKVFGSKDTEFGSQSCVEDSAIRTQVSRDRMERFISETKSATAISLGAEQLLAQTACRIDETLGFYSFIKMREDEGLTCSDQVLPNLL